MRPCPSCSEAVEPESVACPACGLRFRSVLTGTTLAVLVPFVLTVLAGFLSIVV